MKSTLKFALVVLSFAFLTSCGGATKTEEVKDSTTTAPVETPVTTEPAATTPTDSTATADTTKK